jgi:phosphatidylglycerol:prolipoprotein diacylglycerol transferase
MVPAPRPPAGARRAVRAFTALPLAHAVGRLGCFLAGCCYGAAHDLPWAVTYTDPAAADLNGTPLGRPLHPTQLYEALLELGNFAVVTWVWRRAPRSWAPVATWLGLYGAERFALEFLRGDPRGAWLGLSTSQWLALAMLGAALWLLATIARRSAAPSAARSRRPANIARRMR